MSDAVLAAIITMGGPIIAALIARGENLWLYWPLSAYSLLAGFAVWFVVDDGTESRLLGALPELPDYKKQIYGHFDKFVSSGS